MTDDNTARVRAYEEDKERINDLRQGDDTQADVIRRLLGPEEFDGETLAEDMDKIREETDEWTPLEELDLEDAMQDAGPSLSYDDVKSACAAAIREELPVSEMGR